MGSPRFVAIPLLGVAAVLAIVSIFTPWWTIKFEASDDVEQQIKEADLEMPEPASARPFVKGTFDEAFAFGDPGAEEDLKESTLIGGTQATLAGILVIVGIVGFGAAAGLVAVSPKPSRTLPIVGGSVGLTSAAILMLAAILAVATWPGSGDEPEDAGNAGDEGDEPSFWDSAEIDEGAELKALGNFGWYIVLAGGVVGAIGGAISFLRPGPAGAPMPPPGYGTWYGPQGGVRPAQPTPPQYGYPAQRPPQAPWAPPPPPQQAPAYPPQQQAPVYPPPPPQQNPWAPPGQQPVPPPPPPAPPSGWGPQAQPQPAAKLVQCPRCGTRVQAPGFRPVDLVCPSCRFTARLES